MSASQEAQPLPAGGRPYRASYLELFFDLVFIFGLAQLTYALAGSLAWESAFRALVALLALWWVWSYTVWMTNRLGVGQPVIQIVVIVTMLSSLLMAVAAPAAFNEQGIVFAVAYVVIQVGRVVVTVIASGGRRRDLNLGSLVIVLAISLAPWIAGALTSGIARGLLWTLAVALAYTLGRFDLPVIRLSRFAKTEWGISPEHLGERHQHFALIALGDTILAAGLTMRDYVYLGLRLVPLAMAFATTVLLWRIYFYRAGELLPATIQTARVPPRIALWASYAHLLMVAGVVSVAVGDALFIAEPFHRTGSAGIVAILGGPTLFLIGRALLDYITFSRIAFSRPVGLLALATAAAPMTGQRRIVTATVAALVLLGVAVSDVVRRRSEPRQPAPPSP